MLFFFSGLASGQSIVTEPPVDTIDFELTSHNNLSVTSILNGQDTLQLMLHTAASFVTLTTAFAKDAKGVKWDTEEEVKSWGGSSSARFSQSNGLEIQGLKWDSLAIWETLNSGQGTDGKFGLHLFTGKVIGVDFDAGTLAISDDLPMNIAGYQKLTLDFEDDMLFIEGISEVDGVGHENRFLVHTGYGGAILFDDEFADKTKMGDHIEITGEKVLKDSYGNSINTKKGLLPKFTIGSVEFTDVPVSFFEGALGRQKVSVMGGDFLKRFNIVIDADRAFIYLKPNGLSRVAYTVFD